MMSSSVIIENTGMLYLDEISRDAFSFAPRSILSKATRTVEGVALLFDKRSIDSIIDLPDEITSSTMSALPFG